MSGRTMAMGWKLDILRTATRASGERAATAARIGAIMRENMEIQSVGREVVTQYITWVPCGNFAHISVPNMGKTTTYN